MAYRSRMIQAKIKGVLHTVGTDCSLRDIKCLEPEVRDALLQVDKNPEEAEVFTHEATDIPVKKERKKRTAKEILAPTLPKKTGKRGRPKGSKNKK